MSKRNCMSQLFLKLAEYDEIKKSSRMVNTNEFIDQYSTLKLGNGGSWCRMNSSFANHFKYVTRKGNGELSFSWDDLSPDEKQRIDEDFKDLVKIKGNAITHIKIYGLKDNKTFSNRSVRNDIREYFKNSVCVVCGNSDIEIDHKNGLYNDPRVLELSTQQIGDFQPLCRHCNQQKRQSIVYTKETSKRYPATKIPQLSIFGVDYVCGDETYDPNDVNAMVGTYWYDPVVFIQMLKERMLL